MSSGNSASENRSLITEQNGGGTSSTTTESQTTTTTKFSSLGLLLPNRPKPLCKGRSFVNLPPPSRIENAVLFGQGAPLSQRVSSEKLVNHWRGSPPAFGPPQNNNNSPPPKGPIQFDLPKRPKTVRHAPLRHFPSQGRMSIPLNPNSPQQSPRMLQPDRPKISAATIDEPSGHRPIGGGLGEEEDGGKEHILLLDEGGGKMDFGDSEDAELGQGRAVTASIGTGGGGNSIGGGKRGRNVPLQDKASLKSSLKVEDSILRLNIGGSSYRIRTRSILKHGNDTLLGRFVRMNEQHRRAWADAYFDEEDEYFFERVPRYFDPVYDFYASGKLHVPKDLCFEKFMAELRFWAVSKAKMDDCCSPFAQYCLYRKPRHDTPEKDHFIGLRCAKVRRRLWLILEGHSNSKWWKFFEITSTSFVVLSITALILASMPEFQVPDTSGGNQMTMGLGTTHNPTYPKVSGFTISTTVVKDGEEHKIEMVEHPVFNYVENICVIYFTLEYLLRFWVAPQKGQFVREFLNVIDLLAIAPFVFELILIFIGIRGDNVRKVRWAFLTVRLLRVLRVVRIAKLGRFSPGLANFALTLRKSKKQMQMVAIVLLTVIIFFSTLMYFMEKDEPNTTFTSIPAAFWWCLFSQTKWVPQTAAGKLVGGGAITCGVLVLALPIAILVNNFMQVVRLREEKLIKQYATIGSVAAAAHQQQQQQSGGGGGGGTTAGGGDRV